nr:unnamed protein product [Spirometra erinaceieuropaei]
MSLCSEPYSEKGDHSAERTSHVSESLIATYEVTWAPNLQSYLSSPRCFWLDALWREGRQPPRQHSQQ